MAEPNISSSSSPSTAKAADHIAGSVDGRDLSELLRAMTTTTTTIETTTSTVTSTAASAHNDPSVIPPLSVDWSSQPVPRSGPSSANSTASATSSMRPLEASLPTTINRSYKIFGVPTHTFCQVFSDRIVVGVTQLQTKEPNNSICNGQKSSSGHIGSWVYCQASQSQIDPRQVDYELSTLLGSGSSRAEAGNRDEKEIYARRIAERLLEKKSIPGGTNKIVLLLGISLLPIRNAPSSSSYSSSSPLSSFSSIDRFKALVEVLVELIEKAVGIALQRS
mmetsp:Transcript_18754/g.52427  ORF Transcript_18754/g.52427 Transcript_18754/m.52427 type:complete len:278 (+) Transcript_18754:172-1005(+)